MPKILGKYINGNEFVTIYDDGTKIRETEDDEFRPAYAENMDIKICNRCSQGCAFCHEGSTPDGEIPDLNDAFINTLHPYQEVALGGGNVLEHPDLLNFLYRLKDQKVITNITLNQNHFMSNIETVRSLINQKLIYGLGISLTDPNPQFIETVKQFPNAVIHVINGVVRVGDLKKLANKDLKILILGYKEIRRGKTFLLDHLPSNFYNRDALREALPIIVKDGWFNVVSFDNLAIEQLNVKSLLSEDKWNEFYAGDDGTITYYIDMVKKQFAVSSTSPMDERYPLLDSVDEMFRVIQEKKQLTRV